MTQPLQHITVMLHEGPEALVTRPDGCYVDATFGRGGHTREILAKLNNDGRVLAFDRDPQAVEVARQINDPRLTIVHAPFSHLSLELDRQGWSSVDGVFMDIGVSSPQIDDPERGFSFRFDGPLDMRMDTTRGETAADLVNTKSVDELVDIFRTYGEEKMAGRIARAIVAARQTQPFTRTKALADLVAANMPINPKDKHQHPATRVFQALRIAVNGELDELESVLEQAGARLAAGGRLGVITFHSLEDRVVKRFFERARRPEANIDPRLPLRASELPPPLFEDVERTKPSLEECERNPRARSAMLRVGTRTSAPWPTSGV